MKRTILLLAAGLLTLSCVDKAYDLGRLEGGQIAVGDDESEFAAPLVTVTVLLDDIHDSQGSLQEMLDEADIWLPSELPGGVDYVDFQRLYADDAYLAEVTGALVDEMGHDAAKVDKVADLVWRCYKVDFLKPLGLEGIPVDKAQFTTLFVDRFTASEALREQTEAAARKFLILLQVSDLDYQLGAFASAEHAAVARIHTDGAGNRPVRHSPGHNDRTDPDADLHRRPAGAGRSQRPGHPCTGRVAALLPGTGTRRAPDLHPAEPPQNRSSEPLTRGTDHEKDSYIYNSAPGSRNSGGTEPHDLLHGGEHPPHAIQPGVRPAPRLLQRTGRGWRTSGREQQPYPRQPALPARRTACDAVRRVGTDVGSPAQHSQQEHADGRHAGEPAGIRQLYPQPQTFLVVRPQPARQRDAQHTGQTGRIHQRGLRTRDSPTRSRCSTTSST